MVDFDHLVEVAGDKSTTPKLSHPLNPARYSVAARKNPPRLPVMGFSLGARHYPDNLEGTVYDCCRYRRLGFIGNGGTLSTKAVGLSACIAPALPKASPGQLSDCVSSKRDERNPSERHAPGPNRTIRAKGPRGTGHSDRIIHTNPKALKIDRNKSEPISSFRPIHKRPLLMQPVVISIICLVIGEKEATLT